MNRFEYARPETVAEAVALLDEYGPDAQILAGGTDLVIELRNHWVEPKVVIDIKRIPELAPAIVEDDGVLSFSATTVMADVVANDVVQRYFPALAEAADVVGSVQIRARATLAGNICNGSPAADTSPPLLVFDATVVVAGPSGVRRLPVDDFIVGPGKTALERGEMVIAIELPIPEQGFGSAYQRLTRRRGTDLASITLCCGVSADGVTRFAYGSVGPRAFLVTDDTGELADPSVPVAEKAELIDEVFHLASPSLKSLRASPEYRVAMLRVLGARALETAIARLDKELVA
ncbi:MAG: xanthine dehydrogenase family protein subunit M [Acidimicrobiia bacterium]|nr:xanthine dehydrogenase family protein subunit M [Acidimicrobiia bacterium]